MEFLVSFLIVVVVGFGHSIANASQSSNSILDTYNDTDKKMDLDIDIDRNIKRDKWRDRKRLLLRDV